MQDCLPEAKKLVTRVHVAEGLPTCALYININRILSPVTCPDSPYCIKPYIHITYITKKRMCKIVRELVFNVATLNLNSTCLWSLYSVFYR